MAQLSEKHRQVLEHQHYEVVGRHSAVEVCRWAKKSLRDEGFCYKQKFYGINSHRCCQMTPSAGWCNQRCRICWRSHEYNEGEKMSGKLDSPKEIIDGCIKAQIRKLSGFKGNKKANLKKWKEAQEPMHFAVSLTGEPTLYPKLPELIKEINSRGKTSFLVTNGTNPEILKKLKGKSIPTQLYVSLDAPSEELYKKIDIPLIKNGWKKINETLWLLKKIPARKVIRITLAKGLNDCRIKEYAKLIRKAGKIWVEVKAYMWVGYSRKRLKQENMPSFDEVKKFSKKLAKELGWKIIDEKKESRVCLIAEKDSKDRIMKF